MTYGAALLWLFELHDTKDPRYAKAAARWHAMFVIEARKNRPTRRVGQGRESSIEIMHN